MFTIATPTKPAVQGLTQDGLSLLSPEALQQTLNLTGGMDGETAQRTDWQRDWVGLTPSWDRLPPDAHLRDGGHYRRRRHGCYVHTPGTGELQLTPHRAHWQPTDYNALHGGFERWFDPLEPAVAEAVAWRQLISGLGSLFAQVRPVPQWFVEAHQFRIDTAGGVGRPTPEGAHRDGVDFVVVMLVARHGVKGGESRVFDAHGPHGLRFLMTEPLTTLLLDDARVIHETTPILPAAATASATAGTTPEASSPGYRDTLVLTYRSGSFQAPA